MGENREEREGCTPSHPIHSLCLVLFLYFSTFLFPHLFIIHSPDPIYQSTDFSFLFILPPSQSDCLSQLITLAICAFNKQKLFLSSTFSQQSEMQIFLIEKISVLSPEKNDSSALLTGSRKFKLMDWNGG